MVAAAVLGAVLFYSVGRPRRQPRHGPALPRRRGSNPNTGVAPEPAATTTPPAQAEEDFPGATGADPGSALTPAVDADDDTDLTLAEPDNTNLVMRQVYPLCEAPPHTPPETSFELKVGISELPSEGQAPTPGFLVPRADFQLTIQVMADGFHVLGGDSLQLTLPVTSEDPYPYKILRLAPDRGVSGRQVLGVVFMRGGSPIGMASRQIEVSLTPSQGPADEEQPAIAWTLPEDPTGRPDLEIIVKPGSTDNRFEWYFRSAITGIEHLPPQTAQVEDPRNFARSVVMKGIEDAVGKDGAASYIRGVGRQIAQAIPKEVQDVLAQVADRRHPTPPTVLLATTNLYVPWELAWMNSSWSGTATNYLGSQATIGRWVYTVGAPKPAPPREISASTLAVVTGRYTSNKLPEADREAEHLETGYGAEAVTATFLSIEEVVCRIPGPGVLHFAMHGGFDATGSRDGLRLADEANRDEFLGPYNVGGFMNTSARLVFMNACEVAQAREDLSEFTGLIPAFLSIGVGAAIAPWWKVNDTVAYQLATRFYSAVLDNPGISPAEFLRAERASVPFDATGSATSQLAYVYYGHPLLNVHWTGPRPTPAGPVAPAPAD